MNLTPLPHHTIDILTAIELTQREGPPTIAKLAILTLWLVGQESDPHTSYTGPDGLMPLPHLRFMLEKQRRTAQPWFVTSSALTYLPERFPKPLIAALPQQGMSQAEAQHQVSTVLKEAGQAKNSLRYRHLLCQGLIDLHARGVQKAYLQPLIKGLIDLAPEESDFFVGDTPKALLRIGEIPQALRILDLIPISSVLGAAIRADCAKILVETGQPDEARRILERLWKQRDQIPSERMVSTQVSLAEVYAYLGDVTTARRLSQTASPESRMLIECIIAWYQYFNGQAPNLSDLLHLFGGTIQIEPPKSRAHVQTAILRFLRAIEHYDAAWQILPLIQATLLSIPVWSKLEWRTNDVAAVLWPYAEVFAPTLYLFASDLLIRHATDRTRQADIWSMVHLVSGLGWLILRWVSESELDGLIDFLTSWQNSKPAG